ncbi:MAG: biopolymer transporter ExbD, partial [Roseateles sp.]
MKKAARARRQLASALPVPDINTTPLIDVMLVLLVMLIITIPVQLHSVKL